MAKYITYLADADLESVAIKAINSIDSELLLRAVSLDQIRKYESDPEVTLITTREIPYSNKRVNLERTMAIEEIAKKLSPEIAKPVFSFQKGRAKFLSVVGLSGGVGTTSIAINCAFERAINLNVVVGDLDDRNPDIAIALGLHRIENRAERISRNLQAIQGIPQNIDSDQSIDLYVFDLGCNLNHPVLKQSDEIFLVTRLSFNTLNRFNSLEFSPTATIFNFFEKSSFQQQLRRTIEDQFPRMNFVTIPNDIRAFERGASGKSALIEVAPNSLARKSIATLG